MHVSDARLHVLHARLATKSHILGYASLPQHGLSWPAKHGLKPGRRETIQKEMFNQGKAPWAFSARRTFSFNRAKAKGYEFHPDTAQTYDEAGGAIRGGLHNLTTDNSMRLFELGVGWKRTSVDKRLTPHEMSAKMRSDATVITGKGDADLVSKLYKDLHEKVLAFEQSDGVGTSHAVVRQ